MKDSISPPGEDWGDRHTFLNAAGAVEGGLVLVALGIAWITGLDLWERISLDWSAAVLSLFALVPMLMLFAVSYRWPVGSMVRIKELLLEVMGPPLAACHWYDLVLLAALAGLGEELLFRGVLQVGLDRWAGPGVGWIAASMVFGLVHAVTPTYAILAGLMGLYFGWLLTVSDPPNLLVPILVHGLYDLVAFVVLRADYRRRQIAVV